MTTPRAWFLARCSVQARRLFGRNQKGRWCRSPVGLSMVVLLALLPAPALHAESRFDDVRWIVGRHGQALFRNEGFDDVEGVLTSDAAGQRLRFEAARRSSFDVSFDRLTALHYEESTYPSRVFRRSGLYLTIHYTSATGEIGRAHV